ncbi:MAG: hypothetical protein AAFY08_10425 [Planctomycetota bacterium]
MTTAHATPDLAPPLDPSLPHDDRYGRARLWVGITGVGTWVVLATAILTYGLPFGWYDAMPVDAALGVLLQCLVVYAVVQAPFDFLGGWYLPRRYGRSTPGLPVFLARWGRGVLVHGALLLAVAALVTVAGRVGGVLGVIVLAVPIVALLLTFRATLAACVARLALDPVWRHPGGMPERAVHVGDESFTGGITGLWRPRCSLIPDRWSVVLDDDGLRLARARRRIAAASGLWGRGRAVAIGFTLVGVALAAVLVGPGDIGTVGGTLELSLWFTLWSFLGLLTLPTLSRRAVAQLDRSLLDEGFAAETLAATSRTLNAMQDGEPARPGAVEAIFHPIPSLANRAATPAASPSRFAAWDTARTAVYLSAAGLGLLGRAVHCNAGKPALWVFLPTD